MNKYALEASENAGCFYCLEIWDPKAVTIKEWIDTEPTKRNPSMGAFGNATAMCPFCGVDSVLASISVGQVTEKFLKRMCEYWFSLDVARR